MLAFWTRKDQARMDRLFRQSALFDAAKWDRPQSGSTWGDLEIQKACEICANVYDPQKSQRKLKSTSYIYFHDIDESGKPKATLENLRALIKYYNIKVFYNEIKKDTFILFQDGNYYSLDNHREASLGVLMSIMEREDIPVRHLEQFICEIADRNRKNPVKNWILSKPWDKIDRLLPLYDTVITEQFFPEHLKELFIYKWLLSAVAAACHDPWEQPFSARGVLVFAGKQGLGKTRWFRRLAPQEWICDADFLDPSNKDSLMKSLSFWISELGELDSTFKRDMGRLKAFITKEQDQIRVPYARTMSQFPRRTVFGASVNEPEFLVDRTGNDRFWTIPVLKVNYDHDINMQQVFAQLYEEWHHGAEWWLTPEEGKQLAVSNERFEERDEIYDLLTSRLDWSDFKQDVELGLVDWLTATDVLIKRCGFINIPTKTQTNSCATYLRKLTGMDSKRVRCAGGRAFPIPRGSL
jgi:putative DNA primase/helicase